jgi:maltose/moltooligosaccharide transporter
MLAMPFTILTNALEGYGHMGSYLGLFNGTICVPQIVAALVGGALLCLVGGSQVMMLVIAGAFLIVGAVCVFNIKEKENK